MEKKVKITVIIPFYNAENHLKNSLDSVIDQSLREIEIICIDDGSKDNSLKIVKEYRRFDKRIKIINQNNKGPGPARNSAVQISKGVYLAFLDSDDYYPNQKVLEMLYKKAIANKASICGGGLALDINGDIKIDGNPNSTFRKERFIKYKEYQWDYGFYRYIFKTSFIKNNNIQFPELRRYQDPPFLLKAMIKADAFYAVKETTYCYRLRNLNDINWKENVINDLANGLLFCISTASDYKLFKNVANHIEMINTNYKKIVIESLINNNEYLRKIMQGILKECEKKDYKKSIYFCNLEQSVIDAINNKKSEIEITKSKKFHHLLRKIVISINDYGFLYTIKRIIYKVLKF